MAAQVGGEGELLAELEGRFAAVEVPVAADQIVRIAEAWTVVMAVGLHPVPALNGLDEMFPEVEALLRAEKREMRRTAPDPALVAPWDPTVLEPYGFIWGQPADDEGPTLVPIDVYTGLEETFPMCAGDLLNWEFVAWFALNFGWHEAADWLEDHPGEYLLGVYQGFDVE